MNLPTIGYKKHRKHKKYNIYHFYFKLENMCWWSLCYKIKGNKRVNPSKLIQKDNYIICYFPYELTELESRVEIENERLKEIIKILDIRNKMRKMKIGF